MTLLKEIAVEIRVASAIQNDPELRRGRGLQERRNEAYDLYLRGRYFWK
jgi:hypothetical protein